MSVSHTNPNLPDLNSHKASLDHLRWWRRVVVFCVVAVCVLLCGNAYASAQVKNNGQVSVGARKLFFSLIVGKRNPDQHAPIAVLSSYQTLKCVDFGIVVCCCYSVRSVRYVFSNCVALVIYLMDNLTDRSNMIRPTF